MIDDVQIVTCKLIFPFGSVTREQVEQLLKRHTNDWDIANFYPEKEVGCNKMTFAVVDVPEDVVPSLLKESVVKDIDLMFTTKRRSLKVECCGGGGCGPKP